MVVTHNFQDLFEASSKTTVLSLPIVKENPLKIEFQKCDENETLYESRAPPLPFASSNVFHADISDWRRLTAVNNDCKAVYEVTFDVTGSTFNYKPGDTIGVIPQNSTADVEQILDHLNLKSQADDQYTLIVDKTLKGAKIPVHVPVKSTLRHVFQYCLDLRSVIKKLFLLALSRHTKDDNERKVLEYVCSKEGATVYTTHILNKNLCVLDLFSIFKTCKPPAEVLLANLPRLLPRPYSIVNSQIKDPNTLKICFSVMDIGNNRKGLTTGWLEEVISSSNVDLESRIKSLSISNGGKESCDSKIPIYIRKNMSGFLMPKDLAFPMIFIGPGTGVSPYIGFLQERECLKRKNPELNLGEAWLFFGCRDPKLDFIYEQELKNFIENGILKKMSTAFSRVDGCETKYIQDALTQNGEELTKLIKDGASIFICGDLKNMASQVKDVLVQCLIKYDGKTKEEAEKYIFEMQKGDKYFVDTWS
ncbi:methionine synthase reductase [Pectinophora gossypiella]|uniref:methionine synthase reductase n=1 Tax=Pectinophora gossypiella TaxID=13191 RepID=UPI00214F0B38|nr:methionine synthase reductase [Pectinophora gossypiella]